MRSRDGLNLDNIPTDLISLSIQVTDGRNSDEATVRISVKDVNDRKPQFEQTEYVSSVPENAAIGTIIHHVKATDADFGPNAEISYRQATSGFLFRTLKKKTQGFQNSKTQGKSQYITRRVG